MNINDEIKDAVRLAREVGTSPDNILQVADSMLREINDQIKKFGLPAKHEAEIRGVIGRMQENVLESRQILIDSGIDHETAVNIIIAAVAVLQVGMDAKLKLGN